MDFNKLSDAILAVIFAELDLVDHLRLRQVNKRLYDAVKTNWTSEPPTINFLCLMTRLSSHRVKTTFKKSSFFCNSNKVTPVVKYEKAHLDHHKIVNFCVDNISNATKLVVPIWLDDPKNEYTEEIWRSIHSYNNIRSLELKICKKNPFSTESEMSPIAYKDFHASKVESLTITVLLNSNCKLNLEELVFSKLSFAEFESLKTFRLLSPYRESKVGFKRYEKLVQELRNTNLIESFELETSGDDILRFVKLLQTFSRLKKLKLVVPFQHFEEVAKMVQELLNDKNSVKEHTNKAEFEVNSPPNVGELKLEEMEPIAENNLEFHQKGNIVSQIEEPERRFFECVEFKIVENETGKPINVILPNAERVQLDVQFSMIGEDFLERIAKIPAMKILSLVKPKFKLLQEPLIIFHRLRKLELLLSSNLKDVDLNDLKLLRRFPALEELTLVPLLMDTNASFEGLSDLESLRLLTLQLVIVESGEVDEGTEYRLAKYLVPSLPRRLKWLDWIVSGNSPTMSHKFLLSIAGQVLTPKLRDRGIALRLGVRNI